MGFHSVFYDPFFQAQGFSPQGLLISTGAPGLGTGAPCVSHTIGVMRSLSNSCNFCL